MIPREARSLPVGGRLHPRPSGKQLRDAAIGWVDGPDQRWDLKWNKDGKRVAELAMIDYVIGNADRHAGNGKADPNGILNPIDQGLTFPERTCKRDGKLIGYRMSAFVLMTVGNPTGKAQNDRIDEIAKQVTSDEFIKWAEDAGTRHGLNPKSIDQLKERIRVMKTVMNQGRGGVNLLEVLMSVAW